MIKKKLIQFQTLFLNFNSRIIYLIKISLFFMIYTGSSPKYCIKCYNTLNFALFRCLLNYIKLIKHSCSIKNKFYLQLAWNSLAFSTMDDDPWMVKSSAILSFGFPHNPSTLSSSKMEGVTWIIYTQYKFLPYVTIAPFGRVIWNE